MYRNPKIESSYYVNNLGKTLYNVVRATEPETIIEFGALKGYSTVAMAMALRDNGHGRVISYDLWDKYPYKSARLSEAQVNVKRYGLDNWVEFRTADFWEWKPEEFDLFHLDISNDGDIIKRAVAKLKPFGGKILFEGGSKERDEVEWMQKYNKTPIKGSVDYTILNSKFPSISIV